MRQVGRYAAFDTIERRMAACERIITKLEGLESRSSGWTARCPSHKGSGLEVTVTDDGRLWLRCLAGCEVEAVISGLGLSLADFALSESLHSMAQFEDPVRDAIRRDLDLEKLKTAIQARLLELTGRKSRLEEALRGMEVVERTASDLVSC